MAELEFESEQSLTRKQAATRLKAIAAALDGTADELELEVAGGVLKLKAPQRVAFEFELKLDGDETELELELKWSPEKPAAKAPAKPAAKSAKTTKKT